jgi:hypothetical protein
MNGHIEVVRWSTFLVRKDQEKQKLSLDMAYERTIYILAGVISRPLAILDKVVLQP